MKYSLINFLDIGVYLSTTVETQNPSREDLLKCK